MIYYAVEGVDFLFRHLIAGKDIAQVCYHFIAFFTFAKVSAVFQLAFEIAAKLQHFVLIGQIGMINYQLFFGLGDL